MNMYPRRNSGFSLIETMVVVVLTAGMVAMGTWVLKSAQKVWVGEQLRVGSARAASLWEYQFCKELRASLPPSALGASWEGRNSSVRLLASYPAHRFTDAQRVELNSVRLEDDMIRFPTAQIRDLKGHVCPGIVQYRVERNERTGIYGIMRKAAPDMAGLDSVKESLVARSVVSLDLQYQNAKGLWVSEWKTADAIPKAVRMTTGALPERAGVAPNVTYFSTELQLPYGERIEK